MTGKETPQLLTVKLVSYQFGLWQSFVILLSFNQTWKPSKKINFQNKFKIMHKFCLVILSKWAFHMKNGKTNRRNGLIFISTQLIHLLTMLLKNNYIFLQQRNNIN